MKKRLWCKVATQSGEVRVYLTPDPCTEGESVDGLWDSEKSEILIRSTLSEQAQKMTLLHELLHVVWGSIGGDLRKKLLGRASEEMVVSFQEPILYDLLTRNKWLRFPKPPTK